MAAQTLYLGTVLTAGLLSFFSPCIVPLLPVYISVFSAGSGAAQEDIFQRRIRTLFKSCLFVAGISTCFIILGFGAGALGSIIGSSFFMTAIGLIVIVLGLHQTGLIHIKWLSYEKKVNLKRSHRSDYFGVFLLGLTFSFGWTLYRSCAGCNPGTFGHKQPAVLWRFSDGCLFPGLPDSISDTGTFFRCAAAENKKAQ